MSRFIVTLTEAERERLEQHRAALGLRSQADVIRAWISSPVGWRPHPAGSAGEWDRMHGKAQVLKAGRLDTATERVTFGPVDALTGEPLTPRRPMQKGKTK